MKIFFGADHAGFELKEALVAFVRDELGHEVEDMGAYRYEETDDYPDFVEKVAARVAAERSDAVATESDAGGNVFSIVIGGSGQGEAMVANRFKGMRAAVYYGGTLDSMRLSREHNDANILSLGARFLSAEEAKKAVRLWLDTPFSGEERHARRIGKMDAEGMCAVKAP